MARGAETAPVLRVVGVEACCDQVPAGLGVVVGMHTRLAARRAVAVTLVSAHALRVAGEDSRPEAGLVLSAIAPLPGRATPSLRLLPVLLAASTCGVLGAAGYRAHPVSPASGHGRLRSRTVSGLGGDECEG
jgi:hypothetical protein